MITKVEFAIWLFCQDPWQITWLVCWNIFSNVLSHFRSAIALCMQHHVMQHHFMQVYLPATINGKTSSARKVFILFWATLGWTERLKSRNFDAGLTLLTNQPQAIPFSTLHIHLNQHNQLSTISWPVKQNFVRNCYHKIESLLR